MLGADATSIVWTVAIACAATTAALGALGAASPQRAIAVYRRLLTPAGFRIGYLLRLLFAASLLLVPGAGTELAFLHGAGLLLLVAAVAGPLSRLDRAQAFVLQEARRGAAAVRAGGLAFLLLGAGVLVALWRIALADAGAALHVLLTTLQLGVPHL